MGVIGETFNIISLMSPYLVPTYLVMGSMINQDIKAFLYLACLVLNVMITTYIGGGLSTATEEEITNTKTICNYGPLTAITSLISSNSALSVTSSIIGFSLFYLMVPMLFANKMNYSLLAVFSSLLTINGYAQISHGCEDGTSIVLGTLVGALIGGFMVIILSEDDSFKLMLYGTETSKKSGKCKIRNQKYTCKKLSLAVE
tara:strand:+ start:8353 stop:8955 length:603 start_codon:yes stop_codon:yes gene_type:complete